MFLHIQQLEKAIAELQRRISSDPHPLLVGSLGRALPGSPEDDTSSDTPNTHRGTSDDESDFLAEVFGKMSLHNEEGTEFHGSTATSEVRNLYILRYLHPSTIIGFSTS